MDSSLSNRFPALTEEKKKVECPSNEFQRGCSRPCLSLSFRSPLSGGGRRGENKRAISWCRSRSRGAYTRVQRRRRTRDLPIACAAGINNRKRERNNIFHPRTSDALFSFLLFLLLFSSRPNVSSQRVSYDKTRFDNRKLALSAPIIRYSMTSLPIIHANFFNICLSSHVLQYLECIPYYENFFFHKIRDIMIILPDNGQLSMTSIKR